MSWWRFDYEERSIIRLAENYEKYNDSPSEYSDLQHIPEWFIELMKEVYEISHDIDWDLSWDSSIEEWYFEEKRKKIIYLLENNLVWTPQKN